MIAQSGTRRARRARGTRGFAAHFSDERPEDTDRRRLA
jgi:hypothetical protein